MFRNTSVGILSQTSAMSSETASKAVTQTSTCPKLHKNINSKMFSLQYLLSVSAIVLSLSQVTLSGKEEIEIRKFYKYVIKYYYMNLIVFLLSDIYK